jgi:hypothetical protein
MKGWKIAGVTVLFGLFAVYVYQEIQFRKPLTAAEIDGLAAITAGQRHCNWRYDETRKANWLWLRSIAERKVDATFQARFVAAMEKYKGLDPDEQCALLGKFHDLVRPWHD